MSDAHECRCKYFYIITEKGQINFMLTTDADVIVCQTPGIIDNWDWEEMYIHQKDDRCILNLAVENSPLHSYPIYYQDLHEEIPSTVMRIYLTMMGLWYRNNWRLSTLTIPW